MTSAESLPLVIAPPPDGGSLVTRHRILHWKPCSGSQKIGADASWSAGEFQDVGQDMGLSRGQRGPRSPDWDSGRTSLSADE
jgi:hypothetical protein